MCLDDCHVYGSQQQQTTQMLFSALTASCWQRAP